MAVGTTIRWFGGRVGLLGGLLGAGAAPATGWAEQLTQAQQPARPLPPPLATAAAPLVLRGVTVIDVQTGRRLPQRTVVIAGTHIQALGRAGQVRVPKVARVVDARGKYLIPGLWDMHVHPQEYADVAYPLFIANGVTGVRDAGSRAPLATLSQWKREIAQGSRVGPRLIVSGPSLDSPRLGPNADTVNVIQGTGQSGHHLAVPLAAVRRVVDSLKAAGADMLKIYGPTRAVRLALMAEAKRVGLRFGGHAGGSGHRGDPDVSGQEFSDSGATFIDHNAFSTSPEYDVCGEISPAHFDGPRCAAAVERLWQNHTWMTGAGGPGMLFGKVYRAQLRRYQPDAQIYANLLQEKPPSRDHGLPAEPARLERLDSVAARQTPTSSAAWEALIAASAAAQPEVGEFMSAQGWPLGDSARKYRIRFPLVIGTDMSFGNPGLVSFARPGFNVHDALLMMTRRHYPPGAAAYNLPFTPLEALQTATLNPALALEAADSLGTVEAGKLADLVLLDADPLVDIVNTTKIRAVVANGRYYDRAALDQLLEAAHQAAIRYRAQAAQP